MRQLGFAFALAVVAALAPLARDAGATCMMMELADQPYTAAGTVPLDGGVLVGSGPIMPEGNGKHAHGRTVKDWSFTDGGKAVDMVTTQLAPGLVLYTRKVAPKAGAVLTAKDVGGEYGRYTSGDVKLDLPAPVATKAVLTMRMTTRSSRETLVVDVAKVPDQAAFVIMMSTAATPVAMSFAAVAHDKTGATTVTPFDAGGHCAEPRPSGERAPMGDDKITLVWVDSFGRRSPPSKPVAVKMVHTTGDGF